MTTPPHVPAPSTSPPTGSDVRPLRLRLSEAPASGPLDGAWWPRSRDLQTEAAELVDHFPDAVGRIARLLYSRPDWDTVAGAPGIRGIQAARGRIKVGSFPSDDTHVMIVKLSSGQQLSLLVVPFDAGPELAERVMAQAAGSRNAASASTLLGLSGPDQSGVGHAVWNDSSHPE